MQECFSFCFPISHLWWINFSFFFSDSPFLVVTFLTVPSPSWVLSLRETLAIQSWKSSRPVHMWLTALFDSSSAMVICWTQQQRVFFTSCFLSRQTSADCLDVFSDCQNEPWICNERPLTYLSGRREKEGNPQRRRKTSQRMEMKQTKWRWVSTGFQLSCHHFRFSLRLHTLISKPIMCCGGGLFL